MPVLSFCQRGATILTPHWHYAPRDLLRILVLLFLCSLLNLIHVISLVFVDVVALVLAFLGLRFPVHLAALVCLHTVGIMSVLALPPTNASHLVLFSLTHILQSLTLPLHNSRKTSPPATSGDQSSWLFHHQSPILHHRPYYWYSLPR